MQDDEYEAIIAARYQDYLDHQEASDGWMASMRETGEATDQHLVAAQIEATRALAAATAMGAAVAWRASRN